MLHKQMHINCKVQRIYLGTWKSSLLDELKSLEDNVDEFYQLIGVNSNRIIGQTNCNKGENDNEILKPQEKLKETQTNFESMINEHLLRINLAVHNVCALISAPTDFGLPIPVYILLRIAAKIGLIRWKDYKKKPNGLLRSHVYSLTPQLIEANLIMFKTIIRVLGTNIIPFTPFINQTLMRMLEWTRSSNLRKHDEDLYHSIRSQLFKTLSLILEQLSLNINLAPQFLKALLEDELIGNLEELFSSSKVAVITRAPSDSESIASEKLKDRHLVDAIACLENLTIVYNDFLDASIENKLKSFVVQACVGIYRDFGSNVVSLACRRQLLNLLQTIANQPYATSTTEIAYHIFELAEKLESDPEIRSLTRRLLRIGLAHRPTIVSHYDVYNCYGRPMLIVDKSSAPRHLDEKGLDLESGDNPAEVAMEAPEAIKASEAVEASKAMEESQAIEASKAMEASEAIEASKAMEASEAIEASKAMEASEAMEASKAVSELEAEKQAEEIEIDSYMSYFVEKLA